MKLSYLQVYVWT